MSTYRFHIDIPVPSSMDLEEAKRILEVAVENMADHLHQNEGFQGTINYRLGHDDDRQKSNYLIINENGHCSNKKCSIKL